MDDAIDRLLTNLPYSDAQKAKDQAGKYWWEPSCKWFDGLVGFDGSPSEKALAAYKQNWSDEHGTWLLVDQADPEPVVQVPARILAVIAEVEARRQVRMPRLGFSPAAGAPTFVNLKTAVWAVPGDWTRVSARAEQGAEVANVWADPTSMTFDGLPAGSQAGACGDGGHPYQAGVEPACYIQFARSGTYPVTITVTWEVGADVALDGVPTIETQATQGFRVLEVQAVGSLRQVV